jgi:eukaryotic-like serine/threonine-protein kinase
MVSTTSTRGQHLIGKEVGGCLLEQLIGYGGSSAVFLAQPQNSDQKVAVKVFLPRSTMDIATQKSFYRRFLREAQAASELEHPNILSIYSYGEHQGLPYIVMPYLPGGTLAEYVREHGPLTLRDAQSYIRQITDALDYAHQQGCVHCDVKPANILLGQDGQVVLSDFGIVRFMQGAILNAQQSLKSSEMLMGTPEYASPEQALGESLDGRSDIYSLAVSLYFLLTGLPPFTSNAPISVLLMHVHDTPPKLSRSRADVTPAIDRVIDKALSKWPSDRYQTAGEFSQALGEAVSEAARSRNIDRVALTPLASRSLAENRKELEKALEPVVEVRPLARQPFHFSRGLAIALVLSIVLLGSITIAALFMLTTSNGANHAQATPASSCAADDLACWPVGGAYFFSNGKYGKYHIVNKSPDVALALFPYHTYTDFRLTVTASEVTPSTSGIDYYGVVLRAAKDQSHYYVFEITPYDNGLFYFYRYDGGGKITRLDSGSAPSVKQNLGQDNTITVEAKGHTFTFFVNGVQVDKPFVDTSASAYASGEIGLSVEDQNEEVAFSNLHVTAM